MYVFIAQFRSRCAICQTYIDEGDECAYVDDEVAHADCASESLEEAYGWVPDDEGYS